MRAVLVDWLVEVHQVQDAPAHSRLTVQIIDRASLKQIHRRSSSYWASRHCSWPASTKKFTTRSSRFHYPPTALRRRSAKHGDEDSAGARLEDHGAERAPLDRAAVRHFASGVKHRAGALLGGLGNTGGFRRRNRGGGRPLVARRRGAENRDNRECWQRPCEKCRPHISCMGGAKAMSFHVNGGIDSKRRWSRAEDGRHDFVEGPLRKMPVLKRPRDWRWSRRRWSVASPIPFSVLLATASRWIMAAVARNTFVLRPSTFVL